MPEGERRLAAIMFTDMVGYTTLGQTNESLSLALIEEQRKLIRPILSRHNGREVKTMGDSVLAEFGNSLNAVRCAYDIQRSSREFNFSRPIGQRIRLRIGLHLGDVEASDGDILGDTVNVASRVEPLAPEGCICLTRQVYDQVVNKFELPITPLGLRQLKNVRDSVEIFRIVMPWENEAEAQQLDPKRVAVLPFANMSPDPQDEYFADGMTEELISSMSKISDLSVISRTSIMQYKNRPKPIGEIGRELKAGTILEGSVRKAGNRIRVTVQTVNAEKDKHLWAESYDRDLQDVFAIQSEIAERVASALRVQLLTTEKKDIKRKPTDNIEAYQLYLKGRYHFNLLAKKEEFDIALRHYQEAIRLDPSFATAYAGISDIYHIGSHYNWFSPEDSFPIMKDYAAKAMQLDPRLAEAHAALGAVYFHYEWKWKEAEKEFTRAIELKPSYELVYEMYSYLLAVMSRSDDSFRLAERGAQLASLASERISIWLQTGFLRFGVVRLGSLEEATAHLERIVEVRPDSALAHDCLGFAYFRASRMDSAVSQLRNAVILSKGGSLYKADLALLLALIGQKEEANSILIDLKESAMNTYVSNVQLACILYTLGRHDEAFTNLEQAYARRSIDLADIRVMPEMGDLREDPKWISIEDRMGLRNL